MNDDFDISPAGAGPGGNGVLDQDALAAEWEKSLADGDSDGLDLDIGNSEEPARVLNQDEIDSLLGIVETSDRSDRPSGIQAILNSGLVSYERLPMLEVVFDRLIRLMSTSLRKFTNDNVEVSLDSMQSVRFGDYLNSIPLPALMCVLRAVEWDNYGLLTVDSALTYSIVDVLLGGRRGTAAMRIEGRPYTTVERSLVERMIHVILADLSGAFEPVSPVSFRLERMETNPRFAAISRPSNAAILARLRIDMEDRGGTLDLFIPYAMLEPIRELLLQMFMGEKFGHDSIWESHLAEELWFTEVEMTAILGEQLVPLRQIAELKVGSTIVFNTAPDSLIGVHCGGVPMYSAKMGRQGARIAVKIEQPMQRRKRDR